MTHGADVTRLGDVRAQGRMIMDARGEIRAANDAVHELLRYRGPTLVGLSLAWIMPPSRHTLLDELKLALRERARRCLPGVLMREDGTLVTVLVTTRPCTGPRGDELALRIELDDEPVSMLQRRSQAPTRPSALPSVEARGSAREQNREALVSARPARAVRPVDVPEQLASCVEVLHWLDARLRQRGAESPSDRALSHVLLHEAVGLIELCQDALKAGSKRD
jgi:PAS domain S-box-containing protein